MADANPRVVLPNQLAVCESYPSHLTLKLEELRRLRALCDVTINIGGQSFHAHRAVLAASSGYFLGMFSRGFIESRQDAVDIQGDANSFKSLLQFAYTGELPITETSAYDIIVMANYLQFTLACDTALDFVRRYIRISPEDAFKISVLDFVKPGMVRRLQYYLLGEMKDLRHLQVFLQQASRRYLTQLLDEKDLAEADDNEVVQTIVAWLLFDWDERKKYAAILMSKINFDKITEDVLEHILDQDILGGKDCRELHDKAAELLQEFKTKPEKEEKSMITAPFGCCYDSDTMTGEMHFLYLSYNGSGNSRKAVWKTFRPFPYSFPYIFRYSPATVDGLDADFNPVDLSCNTFFKFIVGDGILYAQVGYRSLGVGVDDITLRILYRYHFKENSWEQVFRPHEFFTEQFRTIYMDKCFYFLDTTENGIINSYNTTTETLKLDHKHMSQTFSGVNIITTYMGRILIYGQLDDICMLQAYDPAKDIWYQVMVDMLGLCYFPYEVLGPLNPIIMQHNGSWYRIAFNYQYDIRCQPTSMPIVHELNFRSVDGILSAEVGELVEQNRLPKGSYGAFQIDADLFLSGRGGLVYKSGQKAWDGPWDESKLEAFRLYEYYGETEICNFVLYTFDSNQLANEESD